MEGKLPLFIVTGASGSGKSYVIPELRKVLPEFEIFDLDWLSPFTGDDWQKQRNIWLRLARGIAAGGRLTVLCGTMMPKDVEQCVDYSCFSKIYYLNLHCHDHIREERLRARKWEEGLITEHITFATWLLEHADSDYDPPMPTIDTSDTETPEVAQQIKDWVYDHLVKESFIHAI
ncbi:nucleoside kinase [Paenibacillus mesotrionivorans]|uniref:Nucleoside kinase n=1 Tax=Paenibacillus mesotrionivorans TaxID=3160968 RepID=A0ACC7NT54_9BACL